MNDSISAFFELVRAGLWEEEVRLEQYGRSLDYNEILRLSEEQSVVGLVAAGIEHVFDVKIPQKVVLQFVGQTLQLEQRNSAMNTFIGDLVEKMREKGIYVLLVKGQGIAQCYERPLWRASGDIDFLLSEVNYTNAKELLLPLASFVDTERGTHLGMSLSRWYVELHGDLYCGLSSKMDRFLNVVQNDVFCMSSVRSWQNGNTQVFLPGVNNDVIFIFTHFLKHFYKGGLGLRQICDWCRLLWTYRKEINREQLKKWVKDMGLFSEWKAFAAFAVEYLGMPQEAIPFYSNGSKWRRKANRICDFVLKVGNMGVNRDLTSYDNKPYLIRKTITMGMRLSDLVSHARIFPLDSMRFFPKMMFNGVRSAMKGY